jgi:predicted DNA-binding transcriptional regulator YafY
VLRDIEALSAAGVPVYAERGRHGGFALLPGFRTELTGLNHDEALALLVAGSRRGAQAFGLGSALASAMLKVVDVLPESHRDTAAGADAEALAPRSLRTSLRTRAAAIARCYGHPERSRATRP